MKWRLSVLLLLLAGATVARADWRGRVIYFSLLDRFANGDVSNDFSHGDSACNRSDDPHAYQGGDLQGLGDKLDYIRELGADTIWLTPLYRGVPVKEGDNCGFPGYWADFREPYEVALDPRFGTPESFDRLLERAHERDMRVLLDMVVNHAGYGAELTRQHPDWFTDPQWCHSLGDPAIYCPLAGLPDFDHRRRDVQSYLVDVHRQWLERFAIDGIRMDTVKHVEPWYFAQWNAAMRDTRQDLYVIGELLDEHSWHAFDRYLAAGFDGLFNFPLRSAMIRTFAHGNSVDDIAHHLQASAQRFGDRSHLMVNLLDNHDVPRFLENMPHDTDGQERQRRYLLAMTTLLTIPGIPQIYYGNEIGMYGGHDPYNRRMMPGWAWSAEGRAGSYPGYLPNPDHVFSYTQRLLRVRGHSRALRQGEYREVWRQNGSHNANVWAFLRSFGEEHALVVVNNGSRPADANLPMNLQGAFADGTILDDHLGFAGVGSFVVANGHVDMNLPGRSAIILLPRR